MSFSFTSVLRISLIATLALAAPLSADTLLFSNFGLGGTYLTDTGSSWATGGSGESGNAVIFTGPLSGFYTLSEIQVADNFFTANPDATSSNGLNDLMVGLWESSGDLNSATELETWSLSLPTPPSETAELFTLTPLSSNSPFVIPVIQPGLNYFITENVPPDPIDSANTALWGWQQNNLSQVGYYSNFDGAPWFGEAGTTPVFSVSGDLIPVAAAPEPASYGVLMAAALLAMGLLRRVRCN